MQPDPEDRHTEDTAKARPPLGFIISAVVVVAALLWYFLSGEPEPPPPAPPPVAIAAPEPEAELPPAPDIPEPPPEPQVQPEPVEPPVSLATSDAELRERLGPAGESALLQSILANDNLVERGTALINSLSRGIVVHKLLPVSPPKAKFSVTGSDGQLTMDPTGYARYDDYARAIEDFNTETLVETFHRFRPLLEETYTGLGYQAGDFDNAVIRALDNILATPRIEQPIAVVKSEAIYKFVDPGLERSPALQKQLLRMGPDNIARIQSQARALREALLAGQP